MKLPDYLQRANLESPVNYEWTRRFANKLQAVPGEDHPKLWDALEEISVRAAYALGVACSEWAVARLQHLADISDALLRIEAAWAATIDWRYANLPEPEAPDSGPAPDPVAEPVWLAALFLTDLQANYVKTYQHVKNQGVRGTALPQALLVRQITPKKAGFDKWLTASLRKAKAHYPAADEPIQQEAPVPPDFYDPEFKWSKEAVAASQARLLASLNPSKNPHLRKPDQMAADGFTADPYPKSGKRQ
jgi:hypothetical protein